MNDLEILTNKLWWFIQNEDQSMIVNDTLENVNNKVHMDWRSRSPGYDTKEELMEVFMIQKEPCKKCGKIFDACYHNFGLEMIERGLCFTCLFWEKRKEIKDRHDVARINGTHYQIARDDPNAYFKGFGGREFKILFNDGRRVITHNLWCQGNIPERFRDELPDNAVFFD